MTSSSEAFEQDCPLTRRLQQLLHQYDAGTTLQELVQNADDANATKVIFILDLRKHGTASLIAPAMKMMQGPALLQYDDAIFLPENFAAVRAHARVGLMLWSCIAWARCAAHARSHTAIVGYRTRWPGSRSRSRSLPSSHYDAHAHATFADQAHWRWEQALRPNEHGTVWPRL